MTANVGTIDRLARIILGAVLIALPFLAPDLDLWTNSALRYGAMVVGAVLVLTAVFKFCPLYRLLGVRTCKV